MLMEDIEPKQLLRQFVILEAHKWDNDDNVKPSGSLREEIKKRNPYLPMNMVEQVLAAPDLRGRKIKGMADNQSNLQSMQYLAKLIEKSQKKDKKRIN